MKTTSDRMGSRVSSLGHLFACAILMGCMPSTSALLSSCSQATEYRGAPLRSAVASAAVWLDPAPRSGLDLFETQALDRAFEAAFAATSATSMTAAVWQKGGDPWARTEGAQKGELLYWASVGKLLTSTTILRLEADGRLSLDDPVSRFLSHVPNGDLITLRMLMAHSSGLPDASEGQQSSTAAHALTLSEEVKWLQRIGPSTCPGALWRYSNSGYALLGGVIESATGLPYPTAVTELVLSRSSATQLRMIRPDDPLSDMAPLAPSQQPRPFDVRTPQAAGGALADASSMARFLRDLLSGQILPRAQVHEMFAALYPMNDEGLWYGFGAMVYDVPGTGTPRLWLGHSGGVPGARAIVAYSPSQSAVVAVALAGDGSAEATANLFFSALDNGQ